jgi:peptidoglycan/LPS O-acetylase OafA/YrhL
LDRFLRLFPVYWFVAALTAVWWLATGQQTHYLRIAPDGFDWLANLTIIPLNFYMVNGTDAFTLIPPAWSLGAELQFYLLVPLLMLVPGLRSLALAASSGVQGMATIGLLESDWFGYRLLPGVLCLFLAGSYLYDCHQRRGHISRSADNERLTLYLLGGGWLAALLVGGRWGVPNLAEVAIGTLVGFWVLDQLALRRRRWWDDRLGDIAYTLFLVHFLVIWAWPDRPDGVLGHGLLLAVAGLAAVIVYWLVDRPCEKLRHRWRRPSRPGAA